MLLAWMSTPPERPDDGCEQRGGEPAHDGRDDAQNVDGGFADGREHLLSDAGDPDRRVRLADGRDDPRPAKRFPPTGSSSDLRFTGIARGTASTGTPSASWYSRNAPHKAAM